MGPSPLSWRMVTLIVRVRDFRTLKILRRSLPLVRDSRSDRRQPPYNGQRYARFLPLQPTAGLSEPHNAELVHSFIWRLAAARAVPQAR